MNKGLVINFFLNDDFFPVIRFEKVILTKYYKSHQVLSTESFEEALGGLEILIDGHKAIFMTNEFHDIMEPFCFLLESLVKLKVLKNDYFKIYITSDGEMCTRTIENNQRLELKQGKDDNIVLLSFLSEGNQNVISRNNPYFRDFEICKYEWIEQSIIAINEFLFIVKNNEELKNSEYWSKLIEHWELSLARPTSSEN